MRLLRFILLYGFLLGGVQAQLQIGIQLTRDQFVLFEPVPIQLTIANNTGEEIVLGTTGDSPWLSFLVYDQEHHSIRADQKISMEPVTIAALTQKTISVNLTPLYSIRDAGQYRVQAVVTWKGQQMISKTISFNVANAQKIWTKNRPVDGTPRTYSLLRFSPNSNSMLLFIRIEDIEKNLVYATSPLGEFVTFIPPETMFDTDGKLHILHPKGRGSFRYSRIDENGTIEHQVDYNTSNRGRPTLTKGDEGLILVQGGIADIDQPKREKLSTNQRLAP